MLPVTLGPSLNSPAKDPGAAVAEKSGVDFAAMLATEAVVRVPALAGTALTEAAASGQGFPEPSDGPGPDGEDGDAGLAGRAAVPGELIPPAAGDAGQAEAGPADSLLSGRPAPTVSGRVVLADSAAISGTPLAAASIATPGQNSRAESQQPLPNATVAAAISSAPLAAASIAAPGQNSRTEPQQPLPNATVAAAISSAPLAAASIAAPGQNSRAESQQPLPGATVAAAISGAPLAAAPGAATGEESSGPVTGEIARLPLLAGAGAAIAGSFSPGPDWTMPAATLNRQSETYFLLPAAGLVSETGKVNILTPGDEPLSSLQMARQVMEKDQPGQAAARSFKRSPSARPEGGGAAGQPLAAATGELAGAVSRPAAVSLAGRQPASGPPEALVTGKTLPGDIPALPATDLFTRRQHPAVAAAPLPDAHDSPARLLLTPLDPVATPGTPESRLSGLLDRFLRPAGKELPVPAGRELAAVPPAAAAGPGSGPAARLPLHPDFAVTGPDRQIIEQVVSRVIFSRSNQETSLVLTLHPRELGEVRIELVSDKDGLQAHLYSRNQQVQDVLERHLPRLREAFEQQGLKIHDLQVGGDPRRDGGTGSRPDQGLPYHSRPGAAWMAAADNRGEPELPVEPLPAAGGWSRLSGFSLRI